jgi:hypothetical protein
MVSGSSGKRLWFESANPDAAMRISACASVPSYGKINRAKLTSMYEISGLHRRIDNLERDFQAVLERIDRLEALLREEDRKINHLEREIEHEHEVIGRIEHGRPSPVGL